MYRATVNPLYFKCLSRFIAVAALLLFAQTSFGQISKITADLKNVWFQDSRGPAERSIIENSHDQLYNLGVRGYVYNRKLIAFDIKSSYMDINTDYGIANPTDNRRRKEFGYYDASATLFPENGFKLRVFGRHNRIDYNNWGIKVPETGESYQSVLNNRLYGVTLHFPRNTYYPRIDVTLSRNLQKCEEPCDELYQREDVARLTLANSSSNGSSYNAEYRGRFMDDFSRSRSSKEHQIKFRGQSTLSDGLEVNATGHMVIRDAHATRYINVFSDYFKDTENRHRLNIENTESRFSSTNPTRLTRSTLDYKTYLKVSKDFRSIFGAQYETQTHSISGSLSPTGKFGVNGQVDYVHATPAVSLSGTARLDAGIVSKPDGEKRIVQQSGIGGGASVDLGQNSTLLLKSDAFLQHMDLGGTHLGHTSRFELHAKVIPALPFTIKAIRSDDDLSGQTIRQ